MDENGLEIAIEEYKQQFLQVQTALQNTGEESQEELVKLRDDLVELISISEESLLSLKKSRLLRLIEEQEQAPAVCAEESKATSEGDSYPEGDHEGDSPEDITGMKCRVTYTHEWGAQDSYNAIVFGVEPIENESDPIKVRVLFMNPTHTNMVPCPYFLDGKCKFTEKECRYSHGYLVDIEELKPFKELDFSQVQVDQKCLARYDDGVWYRATIQAIKHDAQEFIVHFDTYNVDATLGLDAVLPLEHADSTSVSDNEDSSSISSDSEGSKIPSDDEEQEVVRLAWKPSGGPVSLGDWEQYTTGIGSKLMAKMGYIFGKGLGKDGSGRVEPVEVVVLPKGKSLDRCAELRQQGRLAQPFKKKKRKNTNKNCKADLQQCQLKKEGPPDAGDIFSFINNKLGHKKGNIHDIRVAPTVGVGGSDPTVRTKTKVEKNTDTNWNLQLFKIHEEIKSVKKQLQKDRGAVSRQQEKSAMARHFEEKLERSMAYLAQLEAKEKSIQRKLHQKSQHKKLTVF